ncbi:MAG: hypothetical protein AAGB32_05230 [Pseudomonadota bacterium]
MSQPECNIDELLESYDYETDPVLVSYFHPVAQSLWEDIQHYGDGINDYGKILAHHLERTSKLTEKFLVEKLGFSEKAGHNFYNANLFQDLGKIHPAYDPAIWDLPHRPTEEERAEKRKHVDRGEDLIDQAIAEEAEKLNTHPHIYVIKAVQMYHHEKVSGEGRYHVEGKDMGKAMKAICIVDAYDGDMIHRPHQPAERTPEETLKRMQEAEKYEGAFDPDILAAFIDFQAEQG